jgi:3-oxoacyl-[acyl-carrier-protein] synthase III
MALPEKVVTNADLAGYLDTSDAWIVERTGIKERHIGESTVELAAAAGAEALRQAGVDAGSLDLVLLATTTPDQVVPASSAVVSHLLGASGGAMDLNAACAGFVYALVVAHGLVRTGMRRVLVIGAETLSRFTDWQDRSTAVLFGDAAGAVVVESTGDEDRLIAWELGADGSAAPLLYCDHGGKMQMEGREVFRRAVRVVVESVSVVLERAGVDVSEIALCVPHQANVRIIEAANARLGIPMEKTAVVLDRTGNTSAASIPTAVATAARDGRVKDGDLVLMCGFGAGMTWASALLRWGT